MATVPPRYLDQAARILGRKSLERPTAAVFRNLARLALPPGEVNAAARNVPAPALRNGHDVSPLSVRFNDDGAAAADGPLAGETVVVKDSIDIAGSYTGMGLRDGGDFAREDATIVTRVREAGGRIIGKAKMTELGMDGLGAFIYEASPGNPRARGYLAGGSSTGTAVAVASGLARFGVGGDGLGSVRIPSAFCGLVGLKPGFGVLPSHGYLSPAPSMDVPGPMARDAADCALLWQVLAGEKPEVLTTYFPKRVGLIAGLGPERATHAMQTAFHRALTALGTSTERVSIPGADKNTLLGTTIGTSEIARSVYATRELSAAGRLNLALGRSLSDGDRQSLALQRTRLREATLRALDAGFLLAMPTTAVPAPAATQALRDGAQNAPLLLAVALYTPLANITGLPAIAIPSGVDERGRPLSIMFVGAPGSETTLLRVAIALESTGVGTLPV